MTTSPEQALQTSHPSPEPLRVAVLLSGCGFQDGAEIHESVCTLLALSQRGAAVQCFAPDMEQACVVNHFTGEAEAGARRNVLVESARIARGVVAPLADFDAAQYDALILPGGFGAALNLSDFASRGADCTVQSDVARAITSMHQQGKPIGALCIAPVLLARLLPGVQLTIGSDSATASAVQDMGAQHHSTQARQIVVDAAHRLVSTPCYMLDSSLADIFAGADALVAEVLRMAAASR